MWLTEIFTRKKAVKTADEKLDDALEDTFPASDPPAMTDPNVRVGQRRPAKAKKGARAKH